MGELFVRCDRCSFIYRQNDKECAYCASHEKLGVDPEDSSISGRLARIKRYLKDARCGSQLKAFESVRIEEELQAQIERVGALEKQNQELIKDLECVQETVDAFDQGEYVERDRVQRFIADLINRVAISTVIYAARQNNGDYDWNHDDGCTLVDMVMEALK